MSRALRYIAATGHLVHVDNGHLLNTTLFACNGETMPLLTLTGFDDAAPCQMCDQDCQAQHQVWDGTLMPTASCVWQGRNANGFGGEPGQHLTVNDQPLTVITLSWNASLAVWRVELLGDATVVWDGYGPPNDSPVGGYFRTTGCWNIGVLTIPE